MASAFTDPILSNSKFLNWVKAALAVLITKKEIEPFVYDEIKEFQQQCLQNIITKNHLPAKSTCSKCCIESIINCPFNSECNAGQQICSYHKKNPRKYISSGCPENICHHLKSDIQSVHRYNGPSYKNTDVSKWCSNPWEVAKCYMPPDAYKDVSTAADTDFNGIISVILNHKGFDAKISEDLSRRNNIFDKGREVGKAVRHCPNLEVEDTSLTQYFIHLKNILSDRDFIAIKTSANNAKQQLEQLENGDLIIGKDVLRQVFDEAGKEFLQLIRNERDESKKEDEKRKLDLIDIAKMKVQDIADEKNVSIRQLKDALRASVDALEAKAQEIKDMGELKKQEIRDVANESVKSVNKQTDNALKIKKNATKDKRSKKHKENESILQRLYMWVVWLIRWLIYPKMIRGTEVENAEHNLLQDVLEIIENRTHIGEITSKTTVVAARFELRGVDERYSDLLDSIIESFFKESKSPENYEDFLNKFNEMITNMQRKTGAQIEAIERKCVVINFICKTNKQLLQLLEYFDSDDLIYRLEELTDLLRGRVKAEGQMFLSFTVSTECLENILRKEDLPVESEMKIDAWRDVLDKTTEKLIMYMIPDPILNFDTDFELMTLAEKHDIEVKKTTEDKNRAILGKVTCEDAYTDIKKRMKQTGQSTLVEFLRLTENGQDTKDLESQLDKDVSQGRDVPVDSEMKFETWRNVLDKTTKKLIMYMIPDPILNFDTDFELMTLAEKHDIEVKKTAEDKNRAILGKVISEDGYTEIKKRLKQTGQSKLVELLSSTENGQDTRELESQLDTEKKEEKTRKENE